MSNAETPKADAAPPADEREETDDAGPEDRPAETDADLAEAMAAAAAALDGDTAAAAEAVTEPDGDAPRPSAGIQAETPPDADVLAAEIADLKDRLLRAMAETENIRRRAERDKGETAKYAIANFARDMLGVADNVRRALDTVTDEERKSSEALEKFVVGLEMVEREALAALERHGVRPIDAHGKRFDSNLHEAMFEYDDPVQPHGNVGQVLEIGYTLHDRLLRPAKVGVTRGGPKAEAAAASEKPKAPSPDPQSKDAKSAYDGPKGGPGEQLDESL